MSTDFDVYIKRFEKQFDVVLPEREPVIARIDGRAFHTYTKGMKRFDDAMRSAFMQASLSVMQDVRGAKVAYHQSDEVSILIKYYDKPESQPFFGNRIQKLCSIIASHFTAVFNSYMTEHPGPPAQFDCRVFTIPTDEVPRYFIWRQMDCIRNSIMSHALSHFSHKELKGIKAADLAKTTDWDKLVPSPFKYGTTMYEFVDTLGNKQLLKGFLKFGQSVEFFKQFNLEVAEPASAV
jgi:tRNA(His) guanylyltransferase